MKPWKQRIQSTFSAETDLKSLVAEAIAAAMDASEVTKKTKQAKELEKTQTDFQAGQWSNPHPI